MQRHRALARLALLGSALVWGTSFVVVQKALADLPVFHLLACRFLLATLLLLPIARGRWSREALRDGGVIGLLLFAGFVLQTYGLLWTTPSRSAFLTGLSVVLVPLVGLLLGRPLRLWQLAGSLCAALGLYVLYRPAAGAASVPFGRGDFLTLACAVVFAFYVLQVEKAVRRHSLRSIAVLQFGIVAFLSLPSFAINPPRPEEFTGYALFAILLMGVLATAGAFLCQLYAQRHLSAVETGVILTLEPVIAAAFSVLLGIERWTTSLTLGGALVIAAMLLSELGGRSGPGTAPATAPVPRSEAGSEPDPAA
jgi:drug/metabolite transporter (DMT)-like permease